MVSIRITLPCRGIDGGTPFPGFDELRSDCIEFDHIGHSLGAKELRMILRSNVSQHVTRSRVSFGNRYRAINIALTSTDRTGGVRVHMRFAEASARQPGFYGASVSKQAVPVCDNTANMPLTSGSTPRTRALLAASRWRQPRSARLCWSGTRRTPATLLDSGFRALVGAMNCSVSLANSAELCAIVGIAQRVGSQENTLRRIEIDRSAT